jgi:hypothetical protein
MMLHHSFVNRLRLGLGVLVATTLLGLIAILGSEHRVGSALDRSHEALSMLDGFKEVQIQLLAARATEREFLLEDLRAPSFFQKGDSPALQQHRAAWIEFDQLLSRLELEPGSSEFDLEAIRQASDRYEESFEELVSLYRERGSLYSGQLGAMRRASFEFQEQLEELKESRRAPLRAEVLELVRDQADYLRDLDNRPRFLLTERLKILREEVDKLGKAKAEPLTTRIDAYETAWLRLLEIDDRIGRSSGDGLRGVLRSEQETVIPLTLAAVEGSRASFEEEAATVRNVQTTARLVSAGAVLLAVAIAAFLAVSLGSQVRNSLATLLRAVDAYARGERSARVGTLARRDEFAVLGESFDRLAETLAETTEELEEINASLELAIKGDTSGLLDRIKTLLGERRAATG